jgi:alpha/beta superfamily hydrolase
MYFHRAVLLALAALVFAGCTSIKRSVALGQMAEFFEKVEPRPILATPDSVGLAYEKVAFSSSDGVGLSAWFMPAKNSEKIVIFNHFMMGNKSGAPPHPDWGNVPVDFLPQYKHLVDAGYSVFSYDLRNHGESTVVDGGKLGLGIIEARDVVGAIRHVRKTWPDRQVYILSQCYGTVATMHAMQQFPDDFKPVRAMISVQPLTPKGFVTGVTRKYEIAHEDNVADFGKKLEKISGFGPEETDAPSHAVRVPTLMVQVRADWRTTVADIERVFAAIPVKDKKMFWIETETKRLEGYNYFSKDPSQMLAWLNSH